MMKKLMFFAALFLMIAAVAQAQTQPENKEKQERAKPKKTPEHRAELRAYYEKEMYPILKANHETFDAALAADDLKLLKEKRSEHQLINKEQRKLHGEMRRAKKAGKSEEDIKGEFGPQMEKLKTKHKDLYASLQPFIEKNRTIIDKYMGELKPHQEKWRTERKAINEKYGVTYEGKKRGEGKNRADGKAKGEGKMADRKIVRYILWDGEMKKQREEQKDKNRGKRF